MHLTALGSSHTPPARGRGESSQPLHEQKTVPRRPHVAGEGHGEEPRQSVVTGLRESSHRAAGGRAAFARKAVLCLRSVAVSTPLCPVGAFCVSLERKPGEEAGSVPRGDQNTPSPRKEAQGPRVLCKHVMLLLP